MYSATISASEAVRPFSGGVGELAGSLVILLQTASRTWIRTGRRPRRLSRKPCPCYRFKLNEAQCCRPAVGRRAVAAWQI